MLHDLDCEWLLRQLPPGSRAERVGARLRVTLLRAGGYVQLGPSADRAELLRLARSMEA